MEHSQGQDIFLRLKDRFDQAVNRSASLYAPRDLRNYEARKFQVRVPLTVFHKRFCGVFGCGDIEIGENCPRYRFGVVKIHDVADKVRAIPREDLVRFSVQAGIEPPDEFVILLRGRLNLETVAGAVVRRTDKLDPISPGSFSRGFVWRKVFQILPSILISEKGNQLAVCVQWDILWFGNGIEVGKEGYRNPVISPNPSVAADHHTELPRVAPAQESRGSGADSCHVDCGVSRPCKRAVIAVWLFQKDRDVRVHLRRKT